MVITAIKLKDTYSLEENTMTNVESILKNRDIFADKSPSSQSYDFPSSHVWISGSEHKESWAPKNWCFWTVSLKKTLESRLDCKEIQHPKGNQSWMFIGRTNTEVEAPILWLPDVKSWLIRKDPDAGTDTKQEEKEMTEDNMVGWNHWLNGHEFEQAPGVGDGQGGLVCCSPWGCKQWDMTERLNNNKWRQCPGIWKVLSLYAPDWGEG